MMYAYKQGSASAKALAAKMQMKQIRHNNSKFKGHQGKLVINWGASQVPDEVNKCKVLNKPSIVSKVSNKLVFFETVKNDVNIPEYTTKVETALQWLEKGEIVLARTKLNGHSGEGIHVIETEEDLSTNLKAHTKMYVKYVPKKEEYRVHVVAGEVIDIRRKARKKDVPKEYVNWRIRNLKGGFIFAKEKVDAAPEVIEESLKAVAASGLDFGAVDVIWNSFRKKAYVLEINTAPGLEGSTVDNYAKGFEKFYKDQNEYDKWEQQKVDHIKQVFQVEPAIKVDDQGHLWMHDELVQDF